MKLLAPKALKVRNEELRQLKALNKLNEKINSKESTKWLK